MAHVPAKFHPDIFNIKTKLDNYDYAYNNNNNNNKEDKIQLFQNPIPLQGEWDNNKEDKIQLFQNPIPLQGEWDNKVPWAQVSHSPIRSRDLKTNYGILKPIHDFLFNFNGN